MSHFSSTDGSCTQGKDEEGREERGGEGRDGDEDDESEDGKCFEEESRWHVTMEVPITATDLSMLLMMRRNSSSLLPE